MEALGRVRDGSTGKIEDGYWTTNMIAVAPKTKHPKDESVFQSRLKNRDTGRVSQFMKIIVYSNQGFASLE